MIVNLFVSHSFSHEHHRLGLVEFRETIEHLCRKIEDSILKRTKQNINLQIYFEDENAGTKVAFQIRKEIVKSDIFLVDISVATENTFYELGYAHAKNKELIVFTRANLNEKINIPADISDLLVAPYSDLKNLRSTIESRLFSLCIELVTQDRRSTNLQLARAFWFDEGVSDIHIICGAEPKKSQFADVNSSDYLYVDNLDDRDALFEVCMFLSRAYPNAVISRHSADRTSPDILGGNIVVIGGPHNNPITRDIMRTAGTKFEYSKNGNSLSIMNNDKKKITLNTDKDVNDLLVKDIAYFGRYLNPFNRVNRAVLCHGGHTFGTVASCNFLADNNQALDNQKMLLENIGNRSLSDLDSLECIVEVHILESRRIMYPKINIDWVNYF